MISQAEINGLEFKPPRYIDRDVCANCGQREHPTGGPVAVEIPAGVSHRAGKICVNGCAAGWTRVTYELKGPK